MECGSIDLAGFLRKNRTKITESELQVFWRQMLEAVHVIHEARIIHRDLKPANFLLVEGRLKLIDFGIANSLQVSWMATSCLWLFESLLSKNFRYVLRVMANLKSQWSLPHHFISLSSHEKSLNITFLRTTKRSASSCHDRFHITLVPTSNF